MTRRAAPWHSEPAVGVGPCYNSCDPSHRAWAARLARLLIDRPVGVELFFHAAHGGVSVIVTGELEGSERSADLLAKSIVTVKVHGADCGEP